MDQITAALKIVTDRMSKRSFSQQFDDGLNTSLSDNTLKKDQSEYTKATGSKQKKKQKLTSLET